MTLTEIIVLIGVAALFALCIFLSVRKKKNGGCSCGCEGCSFDCNKKNSNEKD